MSEEPRLPGILEAHRELVHEAVMTERGRGVDLLAAAQRAAAQCKDHRVAAILGDCREALLAPGTNPIFTFKSTPQPSADEPMTIPKLVERLRKPYCVVSWLTIS